MPIRSPNGFKAVAPRWVIAATVASEIGVPNNSDRASAVRFFDRNWPT
jgi:hypothetical protein